MPLEEVEADGAAPGLRDDREVEELAKSESNAVDGLSGCVEETGGAGFEGEALHWGMAWSRGGGSAEVGVGALRGGSASARRGSWADDMVLKDMNRTCFRLAAVPASVESWRWGRDAPAEVMTRRRRVALARASDVSSASVQCLGPCQAH